MGTSPLHMCFEVSVGLPWPFHALRAVFAVDGVDCMNKKDAPQQVVVLIDSRDAAANTEDGEVPATPDGTVDCDLIDSGVILTPGDVRGKSTTLFQVAATVDPKMQIPTWLLNFAVRKFCYLVLATIRSAAINKCRTKPYLDKTTNPDDPFYAYLRKRMAEDLPAELARAPPEKRSLHPIPKYGNNPQRCTDRVAQCASDTGCDAALACCTRRERDD